MKKKRLLLSSFDDLGEGQTVDKEGFLHFSMASVYEGFRKKASQEPPACAILSEDGAINDGEPW